MCSCGNTYNKDQEGFAIEKAEAISAIKEKQAEESRAILESGGTLTDQSVCPHCGTNLWYFCKNGCIVTGL